MNQDQLRDQIRAEIDKKLGWTPNPERAVAWDEAVTAAMEVVAPLLAERRCMDGCDQTPRAPAVEMTPGQLLHRLHMVDVDEQLDSARRILASHAEAIRCFEQDHAGRVAYLEARVGELHQTIADLREEDNRLRREVEFEARGASTFSGADALAENDDAGDAFLKAYQLKLADFARETARVSAALRACDQNNIPVHLVGEALGGYMAAQAHIANAIETAGVFSDRGGQP